MRTVRNLGFASLAVWLLFPLLSSQWRTVMATWAGGRPTSGLTVWVVDMLTWGRIGKFLQFVAGLAVILDLVDLKKLRAKGKAARTRLDDLGEQARRRHRGRQLHEDGNRLYGWLVGTVVRHHLVDDMVVPVDEPFLRHESALRFRLAGFDEPELRRLSERVRSRLPETVQLDQDQCGEVRAEIAALVHRKFPEEAELFDTYSTATSRLVRIGTVVAVVAALGYAAALIAMLRDPDVMAALTGLITPAGVVVLMFLGLLLVVGLLSPDGLILGDSSGKVALLHRLVKLPVIAFYTSTARILDKARPGHVLRWAAFFLFLHGFALDLLAS